MEKSKRVLTLWISLPLAGHKTGSGSSHLWVSVPVPVNVPTFQLPVVGRLQYLFQPLITDNYCAHHKMVILSWNIAHGCPKVLEWSICLKLKMKNLTMIRNHFILEVVPAVGVIVIVFGIYITLLFGAIRSPPVFQCSFLHMWKTIHHMIRNCKLKLQVLSPNFCFPVARYTSKKK